MNDDNPISKLNQIAALKRIQSLKEDFKTAAIASVRTIDEDVFVAHFLPTFCGEDTSDIKSKLNIWYNIAGTSYSPVNVVNRSGEFVIQVPPIHDRMVFRPIVDRSESLGYVFNVVKQKNTLSPALGANILNTALSARREKMRLVEKNTDLEEAWAKLFTHYGKMKSPDVAKAIEPDEFEF